MNIRGKMQALWMLLWLTMAALLAVPHAAHAQTAPAGNGSDICTNFKSIKSGIDAGYAGASATPSCSPPSGPAVMGANGAALPACTCSPYGGAAMTAADGITVLPTCPAAPTGLLSDIYNYVYDVVSSATYNLFSAFVNSGEYQDALGATFTLMVVVYGVAFLMGVVQPSYGDVVKRLVRMGVVMTLISPYGWDYFYDTVIHFFNDGTDQLVKAVMTIGTGQPIPDGATPFYQFDKLADFLIRPETVTWILGIMGTGGPYGLGMAALVMVAVAGFVSLLIEALRIYAVMFVARSMLLGLAPVFFSFLLFERTRQLFMGWVNALINTALQPILMFTFLSFFMVLMESAATDLLSVDVCWTDFQNVQGTVDSIKAWRLVDKDGNPYKGQMSWDGAASCLMNSANGGAAAAGGAAAGGAAVADTNCPEFPVNIVDILTFLMLVYIAKQFSKSLADIAGELSNSSLQVEAAGAIGGFLNSGMKNIGNMMNPKK